MVRVTIGETPDPEKDVKKLRESIAADELSEVLEQGITDGRLVHAVMGIQFTAHDIAKAAATSAWSVKRVAKKRESAKQLAPFTVERIRSLGLVAQTIIRDGGYNHAAAVDWFRRPNPLLSNHRYSFISPLTVLEFTDNAYFGADFVRINAAAEALINPDSIPGNFGSVVAYELDPSARTTGD